MPMFAGQTAPRRPRQKKLQLLRAYLCGHPLWCAWQVSYRCNFRCGFCNYWRDPLGDRPELSAAELARGAEKLARLGALLVNLSGGEPLLRPDVVEIVQAVGRWHFPFLTTNGWFVTRQLAEELFAAGLWGVSISIDYADPRRHDRRRGMPGAWRRALAAVEHFDRARRYKWQRVNWMTVLLEDNLDQLEPMLRLAAERRAYFMVQPYGRRKTGNPRCGARGTGIGAYLLGLRRRYPNFLSNPCFLSRFDAALNEGVPGCRAGRAFFNIDSLGNVAVCVEQRARPVAHLLRHSAGQIVRRLGRDRTPRRCTGCWYNCRGEIESLYHPRGLLESLPILLLDRGRAPGREGPGGRLPAGPEGTACASHTGVPESAGQRGRAGGVLPGRGRPGSAADSRALI